MAAHTPATPPVKLVPVPLVVTVTTAASSPTAVTVSLAMPPAPEVPWYEATAFWAAALALVGVVLTVYMSHRKMKAELQHATDEAHRARITEARKDAYTKLINDFIAASKLIGGLMTIDVKENPDYADPLLPIAASVNQVWLLSEVKTAHTARELHARVNELFFDGVARLPALQPFKDEIKRTTLTIAEAKSLREDLLKQLHHNKNFNHADAAIQAGLMQSKALQERIMDLASEERQAAADAHQKIVHEYLEVMTPKLQEVMNGVQDFMLLARREMGIVDAYNESDILRQQTGEMFHRMQAAVNGVIEAVKPKEPKA